jgi:hypothetical protein
MVERAPDVGDDSWVVHCGESDRGSGGNLDIVRVASTTVVARNSVGCRIDELGNIGKRTLTHFIGMLLSFS